MSTTHELESQEMSWKGEAGGFSVKNPKLVGPRNPAVLCRSAENTLTLDTKYAQPENPLLLLLAGVVIVLVASVAALVGIPPGGIGGGIIAMYMVIRSQRRRAMAIRLRLDLGTTASEVIVDEKRRRIAFLTTIDGKVRWVVLQFKSGFSGARSAVRDVMRAKCRTGQITGTDMLFWLVALTIIVLFVAACGLFILKTTMVAPVPN